MDPGEYLHEFRVGASFAGVDLDADFYYLPTVVPLDRLHKLSFEALFLTPYPDVFQWIGSPKPTIGAALSLTGDTSWIFAGLTWQLPVFETPLFVEGTVGATFHNGALHNTPDGGRVYGCRALLYVRGGVGVRRRPISSMARTDALAGPTTTVSTASASRWGASSERRQIH